MGTEGTATAPGGRGSALLAPLPGPRGLLWGFYGKQVMSLNGLRLISKCPLNRETLHLSGVWGGARSSRALRQCICLPARQSPGGKKQNK